MSIYVTAIKYDPEWDPPKDDDINAVTVDQRFFKRVKLLHTGLRYMITTPKYREGSAPMQCANQKFTVKGGGKNKKPGVSADEFARIVVCWAQEHCNELDKGEVLYECWFIGESDELEGEFNKRGSFRLTPEEETEEEENEGDEGNDEESSQPESPQTVIAAAGKVIGPPNGTSVERRRAVVKSGFPAPSSAIESEAIQLLKATTQTLEVTARNQQMVVNELQCTMRQFREDTSQFMATHNEAWRNLVMTTNTIVHSLREENEAQRQEATRANNRLIKMTEQNAAHHEGEKKILQYAMNMFLEGMKTQWGAMSREMSWERQIMYQQFDALAQQYKKDNRQEWLKDYSPLLLAAAGAVIERVGSPQQGQVLQKIAAGIAEEREEEQTQETTARPARPAPPRKPIRERSVMGVPHGADPGAHLQQNPVSSIFQLFGSLVKEKPDRLEAVQNVLGDKYEMFDQATGATDDAAARAYGVRFMTSLTKDGLRQKLENVLDDEQRSLLEDIQKQLFGGAPTTKPIPADSASVAELRTFAKQTYNLTFPVGTSKQDMLSAIKEKAAN